MKMLVKTHLLRLTNNISILNLRSTGLVQTRIKICLQLAWTKHISIFLRENNFPMKSMLSCSRTFTCVTITLYLYTSGLGCVVFEERVTSIKHMDLSSTFIWSYVQRLRPYSSTGKQCLDLTQDIVYIQNILGKSSYNLTHTVSHISCFLRGESQVQPLKYMVQTHTHKYNRLSFKSPIVSTKSTGDQHGHRVKSEAKLLATTSNPSLSPRCHSCRSPRRSSCQVAS